MDMRKPPDAQLDDRQFEIAITALSDSLVPGIDLSVFRGSGTDFSQCRQYVPGDPARSMDWRVTARTGRPHVKEFDTLKRTVVVVALDDSRSMRVGSGERCKWDWAVYLAGGIMLATLRRTNPSGLVIGGGGTEGAGSWGIRPTLARQDVLRGLRQLRHQAASRVGSSSIAAAMKTLGATPMDRALVVIVSDLHEPESVASIRAAAGRHEVLALRLTDPAEVAVRTTGIVRGAESETGRPFTFFRRSGWSVRGDVVDELRRGGVATMSLDISEPMIPRVREFLATRQARGGGGS